MGFTKYIMQDREANRYNATKGKYIVILFRIAQLAKRKGVLSIALFWYPFFYKLFVHWILCVEIYPESVIGPGLQLWHVHSLVVHPNTVIGKNCVLRQSTTIGVKLKNDGSTTVNVPIIGDNVDIGANSIIIGAITIGNNVTIGAGSVVIRSVSANKVAVGNPARIL